MEMEQFGHAATVLHFMLSGSIVEDIALTGDFFETGDALAAFRRASDQSSAFLSLHFCMYFLPIFIDYVLTNHILFTKITGYVYSRFVSAAVI